MVAGASAVKRGEAAVGAFAGSISGLRQPWVRTAECHWQPAGDFRAHFPDRASRRRLGPALRAGLASAFCHGGDRLEELRPRKGPHAPIHSRVSAPRACILRWTVAEIRGNIVYCRPWLRSP